MPISLSEAKRLIWNAISSRPPERNCIEYKCSEEDFDVLYAATRIPQVQLKMLTDGFIIKIVPEIDETIEFERELMGYKYALVVAGRLLSNHTDLTAIRWVNQLYTHSYNTLNLRLPDVSKVISQVYPAELLDNDPIAELLAEKRKVQKTQSTLLSIIRPELEKVAVSELNELFNKLSGCSTPIGLVIDPIPGFVLVGIIQLALRHPEMDQEMIRSAKDIALRLIDGISEAVPEARKYLEMGWNPEFDKG